MVWQTIIGLCLVGISITFGIIELFPFLKACKEEGRKYRAISSIFIFRIPIINIVAYLLLGIWILFQMVPHAPKLLPSVIDFGAIWFLTNLMPLGNGYAAGITAYLASNIISVVVFYYTHLRKGEETTKGLTQLCENPS